MLGCVVGQLGDAPGLASFPQPDRLPGQSLVKVTAAALNAIDLLISSGKHPAGRRRYRMSPALRPWDS
jgi:NADPH:quinone reductase-like Zn-dependent oxidoreductase